VQRVDLTALAPEGVLVIFGADCERNPAKGTIAKAQHERRSFRGTHAKPRPKNETDVTRPIDYSYGKNFLGNINQGSPDPRRGSDSERGLIAGHGLAGADILETSDR